MSKWAPTTTVPTAGLVIVLALVAAGCGGEGSPWGSTTAATTTAAVTTGSTAVTTMGAVTTGSTAVTTTGAPTTVRVAPDGTGDAPDLAAAVGLVAPGGTILLDSGEHTLVAALLVDKPLTIRGTGSGTTSVVGDQPPELLRFTGPGDFALEGITFRYQGTEPADGVVTEGGSITFTDVQVAGAIGEEDVEGSSHRGSGFAIVGDTTGTIDRCLAADNQLHGFAFSGTVNVTISTSRASDNGQDGFYWGESAVGTAEGNTAQGNGLHGFGTQGRATSTLTGNTATGNGEGGFAWLEDATGTAEGNTAQGNGLHGFGTEDQATSTLTGNTATGNEQCGFRWAQEAAGTARRNTSELNGLSGFWVADSAAPSLVNNIARSNHHAEGYGSGLVFAETAGGLARRNNVYDNDWGIAVGPDAHPRLVDNDVHDNGRDVYLDAPVA
jgi:nitrous oxidase accessory protein